MPAPKKEFLYAQLADRLELLIREQVWRPGERVPSVRQLSQQHGVSLSTAFQAYYLLENKGVLEARPKSGYFVRRPAGRQLAAPAASAPGGPATAVRIHEALGAVLEARPAGAFAVAVPSPALLPQAPLRRASARAAGLVAALEYAPAAGSPELRRQLARQALRWGGPLAAEQLVVTNGCLEALTLCLRAVARPGDTIAIESPTYYGILLAIENLGLKALELPTDPRTGVSLEHLEAALQRRQVAACLFVPNFNNPLGSCPPDAHKQALVSLLHRWQVPLIEDDIYGELHFGPTRPRTCHAFDADGLVLLCSSFSKHLAPGYRVGWVAGGRYHHRIEQLKFMHNLATAALPQLALAHYLEQGRYLHHLRHLRGQLRTQVLRTTEAVEHYFPADTRVTRPAGGFALWVELPASTDAQALYQQARAQGIGFIPGRFFSAQPRYANCLRLSCGQPWSSQLEQAVETLGRLAGG